MAKPDEKAQEVPAGVQEVADPALVTVEDFLLQLDAADILKAGFSRHVTPNPGQQTLAVWQKSFDAFVIQPVK